MEFEECWLVKLLLLLFLLLSKYEASPLSLRVGTLSSEMWEGLKDAVFTFCLKEPARWKTVAFTDRFERTELLRSRRETLEDKVRISCWLDAAAWLPGTCNDSICDLRLLVVISYGAVYDLLPVNHHVITSPVTQVTAVNGSTTVPALQLILPTAAVGWA